LRPLAHRCSGQHARPDGGHRAHAAQLHRPHQLVAQDLQRPRRTGLAAGTFYNYYRSKDELAAALSDDGARRFAPILKAQRAKASDWESFVRAAIAAYFDFLADEPHPHVYGETPEMLAVFSEVRDCIVEEIARGGAQGADPDYLAAACIGVAREVGDQMLARRPIDTKGATDFAVTMILQGLRGLSGA